MIEILSHRYNDKGAKKASITIRLPKMKNFIIYNVSIFEKDGKKWVSMPSKEYESEGKKKYFPHCGFEDKDINESFKNAILTAFEEYVKLNPPIAQQHIDEEIPF